MAKRPGPGSRQALTRAVVTLAAALSATVFVAASALWVRGYWRHDLVYLSFPPVQCVLSSMRGTFQVNHMVSSPGALEGKPRYIRIVQAPRKVQLTRLRGEDFRDRRLGPFAVQSGELSYRFVLVAFPAWSVVAASAIPPAYWLVLRRRWRRRRLREAGRCEQCGYDVRVTPHRCPECGTAVAPILGSP